MLACSASSLHAAPAAPEPEAVSEEDVPVDLSSAAAVTCHDFIPDRGYGPVPGGLRVNASALFDRTLRLTGVDGLDVDIPDDVTCASLKAQLDGIGESQTVHRKVVRIFKPTVDQKLLRTTLVATFTLPLPVQVAGAPVVLTAEAEWLEDSAPPGPFGPEIPQFPLQRTYDTHIFPQSGTDTVGLFCKPQYEGATEQNLTLGEVAGYDDIEGALANSYLVAERFAAPATCEDARTDLLDKFQAADPGNWGSIVQVSRTVEEMTRYILDNQGAQACQQIELESLELTIYGHIFRASSSFPVATVPLASCFPPVSITAARY
jgi:hypothetical protein